MVYTARLPTAGSTEGEASPVHRPLWQCPAGRLGSARFRLTEALPACYRLVDRPVGEGVVKEVGAFEAKTKLGALLDLVEHGEEVMITRRGKPVAKLVPSNARPDTQAAAEAAARIRARARKLQGGAFDWSEWKDLRDEGRP